MNISNIHFTLTVSHSHTHPALSTTPTPTLTLPLTPTATPTPPSPLQALACLIPVAFAVYRIRATHLTASREVKRYEGATRSPVFSALSATIKGLVRHGWCSLGY